MNTESRTATLSDATRSAGEQLSLLPPAEVPLQFRLDRATRTLGTRHVAEIKQLLAERQLARRAGSEARTEQRVPLRGRAA
jgi:hypothetical protein